MIEIKYSATKRKDVIVVTFLYFLFFKPLSFMKIEEMPLCGVFGYLYCHEVTIESIPLS
jgi:hypothetical protein